MAFVLLSSTGSWLALYLTAALLLLARFVFAPQPLVRDKRVIALVLLLIWFGVIGKPVQAFVSNVCTYAWWAFECWFF